MGSCCGVQAPAGHCNARASPNGHMEDYSVSPTRTVIATSSVVGVQQQDEGNQRHEDQQRPRRKKKKERVSVENAPSLEEPCRGTSEGGGGVQRSALLDTLLAVHRDAEIRSNRPAQLDAVLVEQQQQHAISRSPPPRPAQQSQPQAASHNTQSRGRAPSSPNPFRAAGETDTMASDDGVFSLKSEESYAVQQAATFAVHSKMPIAAAASGNCEAPAEQDDVLEQRFNAAGMLARVRGTGSDSPTAGGGGGGGLAELTHMPRRSSFEVYVEQHQRTLDTARIVPWFRGIPRNAAPRSRSSAVQFLAWCTRLVPNCGMYDEVNEELADVARPQYRQQVAQRTAVIAALRPPQ